MCKGFDHRGNTADHIGMHTMDVLLNTDLHIVDHGHLEAREVDQPNLGTLVGIQVLEFSQRELLLAVRIVVATVAVARVHVLGGEDTPFAVLLEIGSVLSENGPERIEHSVLRSVDVLVGEIVVVDPLDGRIIGLREEVLQGEEIREVVFGPKTLDHCLLRVGILKLEGEPSSVLEEAGVVMVGGAVI